MMNKLFSILLLAVFFSACTTKSDSANGVASDSANNVQVVHITAGPMGYSPKQIELKAGVPAQLVFTRTTESACLEQVQIPAFGIETTDLPLNEAVTLSFTPKENGSYSFVCGMNMQEGTIVVNS